MQGSIKCTKTAQDQMQASEIKEGLFEEESKQSEKRYKTEKTTQEMRVKENPEQTGFI